MGEPSSSVVFIHDNEVKSIFGLLGNKENDLSYGLGYVLSQSDRLLKALIKSIYSRKIRFKNIVIKLQDHGNSDKVKGITDIEITINDEWFFVIEAKIGWHLPALGQLRMYRSRFQGFRKMKRMYIVLSDCKEEYVQRAYPAALYGVPIKSIRWADIITKIDEVYREANHNEKYLLNQLKKYFTEAVVMESVESNRVYVVSLAGNTPSWSSIGWRELVKNKRKYFYPQGKNCPKVPPNYMGFRYNGKLQHIHYVEKYEVVEDVHKYIPEIKKSKIKNHFLLWLGEPFEPRREISNGNIWSNGRLWCMLDTLFTSPTIKHACEISKKRLKSGKY